MEHLGVDIRTVLSQPQQSDGAGTRLRAYRNKVNMLLAKVLKLASSLRYCPCLMLKNKFMPTADEQHKKDFPENRLSTNSDSNSSSNQ